MNKLHVKLLILLLVLPLALAACGGGKTDNAKAFLEAMADNDADKAKENACDAMHASIDTLLELAGDNFNADDISCEEDGDNAVKCTVQDGDDEVELTLVMDDDDKVCGGDLFGGEIPDVEIPDVEIPDVEVPDVDADGDADADADADNADDAGDDSESSE